MKSFHTIHHSAFFPRLEGFAASVIKRLRFRNNILLLSMMTPEKKLWEKLSGWQHTSPTPSAASSPHRASHQHTRDHTDLEKTQRSATTSRFAAQSFAVSRGGVVSSSWRVCCVVSQRAYLFSLCCTFDRGNVADVFTHNNVAFECVKWSLAWLKGNLKTSERMSQG